MPFLASTRSFIRNLFRTRRLNADLDEEIEAELEMLAEEKIDAGMRAEDARRAARMELGGMEQLKQQVRNERSANWLQSVLSDCRFGLRQISKDPGFSAAAILTLALAIGANTTIFSVTIRPMRYEDAGRLMMVWETRPDGSRSMASSRTYQDWRDQNASFESLAAARAESVTLSGNPPVQLYGAQVTHNFFDTFRLQAELGRFFTADESAQNGARVVVLSHGLWKTNFGADPAIVGKTIRLGGEPFRVVGVAPEGFEFMGPADLCLPLALAPGEIDRQTRDLLVVGRLKHGITPAQAGGEMRMLAERIAQQSPETNAKWSSLTQNLYQALGGPGVQAMMLLLVVTVSVVLLMACANVANLLLARGATRRKEIAVRIALGARRSRIVRQLLLETLLLAFVSGGLGMLLAFAAIRYLATLPVLQAPGLASIEVNRSVLGFAAFLCVAATLLAGLAPAWLTSSANPIVQLKSPGSGTVGDRRHGRLRSALVTAGLALSLVLMVTAGLSLRGLIHLIRTDPGFESRGLLTAHLSLPESKYGDPALIESFYSALLEKLRAIPGVEDAAISTELPPSRFAADHPFRIEGSNSTAAYASLMANFQVISSDYFNTLGLSLLNGRNLSDGDRRGAARAAIVNRQFAEMFFPAKKALGSRLLIPDHPASGHSSKEPAAFEIVGIVSDLKSSGVNEPIHPQIYVSYRQVPVAGEFLVIRGARASQLLDPVRVALLSIDPDLPLTDVSTMEERQARVFVGGQVVVSLLIIFALMALIMGGTGLYGVISYSASQRTAEFALRLALGAQRAEIFRLVTNGALRLLIIGGGVGAVLMLGVTRVLRSMIFGVNPYDPATIIAVGLVLLAVVLAASYFPARRAMRADPVVALRYE
jgi:putative ABC transport system permease protein